MYFKQKTLAIAVSAAVAAGFSAGAMAQGRVGMGYPNASNNPAFAAYNSEKTIPAEYLTKSNYDIAFSAATTPLGKKAMGVDDIAAGAIRYVAPSGLNPNDQITFTFGNAKWMLADARLCAEEDAAVQTVLGSAQEFGGAGAANADTVEAASQFGNVFDTTNGVSTVVLRINSGITLPTNTTLVLTGNKCAAAATKIVASTLPTLRVPQGTAAGTQITVTVSATDANKNSFGASASNTIMDVQSSLGVSVAGVETAKADVALDRKKFVASGVNTTATETKASVTIGPALMPVATDDSLDSTGATLDIFLTPSTGATAPLSFASNATEMTCAALTGSPDFAVSGTKIKAVIPAADVGTLLAGAKSCDAKLTVLGTAAIDERDWVLTGTLNLVNPTTLAGAYQITTAAGAKTHEWRTNGTVLVAPFVTSVSGYVTRLYLTNTGSTDAAFTIAVTSDLAATPALTTTVTGGTIPANGSVMIGGSGLGGQTALGGQRGTMIITVAAPEGNIHGVYNQRYTVDGSVDSYVLAKP